MTRSLLSHETQKKLVNDQADGLVMRFDPKRERDKSKGKNVRGKQSWCKSWSAQGDKAQSNAKDLELLLLSQENAL